MGQNKTQLSYRPAQMPDDDLVDYAALRGVGYERNIWSGVSAEAAEAEECRFDAVRFNEARLIRAVISESEFSACDFAALRAQDSSLLESTVTGSRFTGASWESGLFRMTRFENCRMNDMQFRRTKLTGVTFQDCELHRADFQFAEMTNVLFSKCDLTAAQFAHVKVKRSVRFENCTLIDVQGGADLRGAAVQGGGAVELAYSLARQAGIVFEP